jgi:dienelactone hydrolase
MKHRAWLLLALASSSLPLYAQETETVPPEPADSSIVRYLVKPSDTDSAIKNFDDPHVVVFEPQTPPTAQLVVFMPGTGGHPERAQKLLRVVAAQGYRAIGLEYDDTPAVVEVCQRSFSPSCSGDFRRRRVFGEMDARVVDNPPQEAIVSRLVKLLQYLAKSHPEQGWDNYLAGDAPAWDHIVVSGLSQGAGMAAYLAKRVAVARVVLFSSPWDNMGASHQLAPWLKDPSATPPERWFAEYHRHEKTAQLIAHAYILLGIPEDHVLVFDLGLPADKPVHGDNPLHASTAHNEAYAPQWRTLFGHSP